MRISDTMISSAHFVMSKALEKKGKDGVAPTLCACSRGAQRRAQQYAGRESSRERQGQGAARCVIVEASEVCWRKGGEWARKSTSSAAATSGRRWWRPWLGEKRETQRPQNESLLEWKVCDNISGVCVCLQECSAPVSDDSSATYGHMCYIEDAEKKVRRSVLCMCTDIHKKLEFRLERVTTIRVDGVFSGVGK